MDQIKPNNNKSNSPESFTFQQWPVYKLSMELCSLVYGIRTDSTKIGLSNLMDQIRRASNSIPLNLSEGYARHTKRDKITFLRVAKGSVFECVAAIDILRRIKAINEDSYKKINSILIEISRMISAIIRHLEINLRKP